MGILRWSSHNNNNREVTIINNKVVIINKVEIRVATRRKMMTITCSTDLVINGK